MRLGLSRISDLVLDLFFDVSGRTLKPSFEQKKLGSIMF